MYIKNLNVKNFRNYINECFIFTDGINILFGKNAQGKTNCAEAIFYLCTGTSLRIRHDKQLIKDGESEAVLSASAATRYGDISLSAEIGEKKKSFYINGNKVSRTADIMGHVESVFFSPGELRLIQDGPDERRRFLNISVSQLSRGYYTALLRYNKILEQRNNLLKSADYSTVTDTLPVWDEQLCKYAGIIISGRQDYIAGLSERVKEIHLFITDGKETLEISPEKKYEGAAEDIAAKLKGDMARRYDLDMRLGYTTLGPHRDDVEFVLNGQDARCYASQGQTRTAVLSLKLAEVDLIKEFAGEYPVLILDDVMSELDLPRRKKLLKKAEGMQTIITCTHAERVLYGTEANKIRIEGGKIIQ